MSGLVNEPASSNGSSTEEPDRGYIGGAKYFMRAGHSKPQ